MPTKPTAETDPTDPVPETKRNEKVLKVVGPVGTGAFVGEVDDEAFTVTREPSVVASKTLGDKMIAQAAEHGVEVAYVEV